MVEGPPDELTATGGGTLGLGPDVLGFTEEATGVVVVPP